MEENPAKVALGVAGAALVEDGMTVGLGSGTTAAEFVRALGRRVAQGLHIRGVATSAATAGLAESLGITLCDLSAQRLDLAVDGADLVDAQKNLLKGRGGALVREKIVASAATSLVILVEAGKLAAQLGGEVALEVLPFGWRSTLAAVSALGAAEVRLRSQGDGFAVSDNGNYLADATFTSIAAPQTLAAELDGMPGIVGHGIFAGMAPRVLVADGTGVREAQ